SVLLGRGDGTFRSEVRLAVGTVPLFLLAADVNGDGRLDLATANYVSGDVSLLFGRGDGTFQGETRISPRSLATSATSFVAELARVPATTPVAAGTGPVGLAV